MSFTLTINGTEQTFGLNMRFIRELDKTEAVDTNGLKFGVGLEMNLTRLIDTADLVSLENILLVANHAVGGKLAQSDLDAYFEAEDTNLDDLMQKVIDELTASKITSKKVAIVKARSTVAN